jgi:aryl-alcohol dehydrogenase
MKIRAAVARAGSPFTIETCELGEPGADEVLVRVEACGVCHTDLSAKDHGYGTPLPAVLGHEGVGRIVALGEGVDRFNIGDRVVMSFGACGRCPSCEGGAPSYCRHTVNFNMLGRRISGGSPISLSGEPITGHFFGQSAFATHAIASATNVVRLDEDLPPALMTTLACGVQTGVGAIINVLRAEASDAIGIFGCGTVGLAAVMAAKIVGCARIVAVDFREDRLATAQVLGATEIVDNRRGDASEIIKKVGLTLAFDNTGVASVIEAGFAALRPRGRMVLAGLSAPGTKLKIDANRIMAAGRTLRGTVEGDADPRTFIPRMIDWYRRGLLPLERLVTTYPFELIEDAAADMLAGVVIKPVLLMQDNTPRPVGPDRAHP